MQNKSSASILVVGIKRDDELGAIERHSVPESRRLNRFLEDICFRCYVHLTRDVYFWSIDLYLDFRRFKIRCRVVFKLVHSVVRNFGA